MKSILVFGATGTLGTYFVDHLVNNGYKVWAIGRRNVNESYYRRKGIECAKVDISIKNDFKKLPQLIAKVGESPKQQEGELDNGQEPKQLSLF